MKRALLCWGAAILLFSPGAFGVAEEPALARDLAAWKTQITDPGQLRLAEVLEKALGAYANLKDYRCVFYKEEKTEEGLGAREEIFLKFEKPFKIFMKWKNRHKKGVQVFYERGMHDNKLVVHKPGLLLGLVPIVFLDQNSPYVKEGSAAYNIEDAGIGTFLLDLTEQVLKATKENKLSVEFSKDPAGEWADIRFIGSEKGQGFMGYRVRTFFDPATQLPTRMSLFDWQDQITGIYSYEALELNLGQNDAPFKKEAHRRLFKFFFHLE